MALLRAASCLPLSKPPPRPSPKGGMQTVSRRRRVVLKPRTTSDETLLQATSCFSRFPGRGRTRRPRSGAHAARTARTLSLPSHPPRVTYSGPSHHHYHVLRTTYPQGGHTSLPYGVGGDIWEVGRRRWVGRICGARNDTLRKFLRATSYRPHAYSCLPSGEVAAGQRGLFGV